MPLPSVEIVLLLIHLADIFEQQGGQLHLAQQGQSPET
jgi:hypothetical protein